METSISLGRWPELGNSLSARPGTSGGPRPRRLREPAGGLPGSLAPGMVELLSWNREAKPFEIPVGVSEAGPLWINLAAGPGAHCLVIDEPGPARTDLVRTVAFAIALSSRPSLLQMVPIDLESGSLHPLEILPHVVGDTASDRGSARMTLRWLGAEWDARARDGRCWPKMLVVVDNLALLKEAVPPRLFRVLEEILARGAARGIHVTAGLEESERQRLVPSGAPRIELERSGETRWTTGAGTGPRRGFEAATLGVGELDDLARGRAFDCRRALPTPPFPRSDAAGYAGWRRR